MKAMRPKATRQVWALPTPVVQAPRAGLRPIGKLVLCGKLTLCAMLALTSAGCDTRSEPPPSGPSQPVVPGSLDGWHGSFGGTAKFGPTTYTVTGVLTDDGAMRFVVGTSPSLLEAQFTGNLSIGGNRADGSGEVVGHWCLASNPGPHCDEAAPALIALTGPVSSTSGERVVGSATISTDGGEEVWSLDLDFYTRPSESWPVDSLQGAYSGVLVGLGSTVTLGVAGDGSLTLEGGIAGCTGTGTLGADVGGIYPVTLSLEDCEAAFSNLDNTFEGVATFQVDNPWAYCCYYFEILMSTPPGAEPPASLLLRVYEASEDIESATRRAWEGYFSGTVTMGDQAHPATALLTHSGAIRVHIGDSLDAADPGGSAQYVGHASNDLYGSFMGDGIVIGEACTGAAPSRFCTETATGEIDVSASWLGVAGGIRVTTAQGTEVWSLDMGWPTDTYLDPATLAFVEGVYSETLAELVNQGNVVVSVDGEGSLFFQSAASGCTGNGLLSPHADGSFNAYDATLLVENCTGAFTYLNGEFSGLATHSVTDPWDYDAGEWLVIWLSSPDGTTPPTAMTMAAFR